MVIGNENIDSSEVYGALNTVKKTGSSLCLIPLGDWKGAEAGTNLLDSVTTSAYLPIDKYTFVFKQTVTDANKKPLGYFYILSDPEQNDNDALVAELFKGSDAGGDEKSELYSYGIYLNGVLSTGPRNKYPFSTILNPIDVPEETIKKKTTETSTELWYKASGNKIVVVARNRENVLEAITLFSYIFCVFLFLVAFFNLFILLLRIGGNIKELRRILEWNI